jgi:hypothetical protein
MPTIFAQVRGDPVRAGHERDLRRPGGIGIALAAGVPDGGDMVDIHPKAQTAHA